MPSYYTPGVAGVLVESDPRSWINSRYGYFVVQARSRDEVAFGQEGFVPLDEKLKAFYGAECKLMVERRANEIARLEALGRDTTDIHVRACPGTGKECRRWGCLERKEALHAIYGHYLYPNLSLHRFRSFARGAYAIDLVFEIDVHGKVEPFQSMTVYEPYIEAAAGIGRRIYDYLIGALRVPPGFITTSISRMGARVTVDWRAFGPRRAWELVGLIRWIEAQVFSGDELATIGTRLGADVSIDTGIYGTSDVPRIDKEGNNLFKGGWLRPLGCFHTKSCNALGWFRTTPVDRDRFRPEHTDWLTRVSRARRADTSVWAEPQLFSNRYLARWPETRFPSADNSIEGVLGPAIELIRLLDDDSTIANLLADTRASIEQMRQRSTRTRISGSGRLGNIDRDVVERILEHLNIQGVDQGDHVKFDCPRSSCKSRDKKAKIFYETGVFYCHRCCQPEIGPALSLPAFAAEMGCSHLVPWARANSCPIARVPVSSVPQDGSDTWPPLVKQIAVTASSLGEGRQAQEHGIHHFLDDPDERLLILGSGTGVGKTTAATRVIHERELRARAFASRDDVKAQLCEMLPGAKVITGRRSGDNCTNPDLDESSALLEPIAQVLCSQCPNQDWCKEQGYLSQFQAPHAGHIIVHHNCGVMDDLDMFDNEPDVDLVDEDPLTSTIQHVDLGPEQLARFLVARRIVVSEAMLCAQRAACAVLADEYPEQRALYESISESFGFSEGVEIQRVPSSPTLGTLIEGLINALSPDAVIARNPQLAKDPHIWDSALAQHLFCQPLFQDQWGLGEAVSTCDDADIEQFNACRLSLLELSRVCVYSESAEAETPAWVPARVTPEPHELRPPNVLRELLGALRDLLGTFETGEARTSALQMVKSDKFGWMFRLTIKKPFLSRSRKSFRQALR